MAHFSPSLSRLFALGLSVWVGACGGPAVESDRPEEPLVTETTLTLETAVLEQADDQGRVIWSIAAETVEYGENKKDAILTNPVANLYQDGEIILKAQADQGEIIDDGTLLVLKNKVLATDPRQGTVLRGNRGQWAPETGIFSMDAGFQSNNLDLQLEGDRGVYFTNTQTVELTGNIVGTTKKGFLQFRTDHLTWAIESQKITVDQPITLRKYQEQPPPAAKNQTAATMEAKGQSAQLDLGTMVALLQTQVEMRSLDSSMEIATDRAQWYWQQQRVVSPGALKLRDRQGQITAQGNRGEVDFGGNQARLQQGAKALGEVQGQQLFAEDLRWNFTTEVMNGVGNVIFKQSNPPATSRGQTAIGRLTDNSVVVQGGGSERVVTEIEVGGN